MKFLLRSSIDPIVKPCQASSEKKSGQAISERKKHDPTIIDGPIQALLDSESIHDSIDTCSIRIRFRFKA